MIDAHSGPAPTLSPKEAMRGWGNLLCVWRLCDRRACRRTRGCRGNPQLCLPRNFPLLPEGVQIWLTCMGSAQAEKKSFDVAINWINGTEVGQAFCAWHEAVEASLRPPRIARPAPGAATPGAKLEG